MIYKIFIIFTFLTSCAYKIGPQVDAVPGGVKSIAIPIFKNLSQEVLVETYFTNYLLQEFQRSKIVEVLPESLAEATMFGTIKKVEYLVPPSSLKESGTYLPNNRSLATQYNVNVEVEARLVRNHDQKVLWTGVYSKVGNYSAPLVTLPVVNSVNPLYNLSARRQAIDQTAASLMTELHDRMLDKF